MTRWSASSRVSPVTSVSSYSEIRMRKCPPLFQAIRDAYSSFRCSLAPCGHTACAPCLLEWFGSVNSLLRAPQPYEQPDRGNYLRNHTKCCFTCRTAVIHKPIPSYILKDTAQALSHQLRAPGADGEPASEPHIEVVSTADRATMWDAVFKPVSRQRWYVDQEDQGVRRCGSCGHEIEGRQCGYCDEEFSDISDDSDFEQYSSDNSMMFRIPPPAFFDHARWPGEGSDEDDDLSDGENEFEAPAGDWRQHLHNLDFDADPNAYVRAIRMDRQRNEVLPQDFHFGFGRADLNDGSSEEGDSYEGSFIDDDDTGVERHFMRGYDFDGEDDDGSNNSDDGSRSDESGDIIDMDRYGRPTRVGGRQVAYSPPYAGS
jgi:hypothetical protein